MIFQNWLLGLRGCRSGLRRGASPRLAEVRRDLSEHIECLEERCVLSAAAGYSLADSSWFGAVSFTSVVSSGTGLNGASTGSTTTTSAERHFLVRLTPTAVEQIASPQAAQALFANSGAGLRQPETA